MRNTRKRWFLLIFTVSILVSSQALFQLTAAQQESSGSFSDDFSIDNGNWQFLGVAYRDPVNEYLVLTETNYFTGGAAFFNAPIKGAFTASFRYKVGEGSCQGDGFTMFFYKQRYVSLDTGGSLGFSVNENNTLKIVPGYGIEFDGWQNIAYDFQKVTGGQQNPQGDPSSNHIALIKDFSGNHLGYVDDYRIADNTWHKVTVEVQVSTVKVYVDQDLVLEWSGTLDRTYDGFGFSAGTGGPGSNRHIIDDFSITSKNLQTPRLTTVCISSVSQSSFDVKINGDLTFNEAPIANAPIYISYSATGGDSWQDLTYVHTDSDGKYSALWKLSVTGEFFVKAIYTGNDNYLGAKSIVNFALTPCTEQSAFSVTSNSTLTKLSFDSARKELSFNVSGDPGTSGYVNVYIPITLMSDISGLTVQLDGNQIQYTALAQTDGWLLYFQYHHSTHKVMISLGSSNVNQSSPMPTMQIQSQPFDLDFVKIAILVFMGGLFAIVVVVIYVFLTKKKVKSE